MKEQFKDSRVEAKLRHWARAVIAVGMLFTALGGFGAWNILQRLAADADWVAHSQEVKATLNSALANAVAIENSARSFAATGDDAFLKPYLDSRSAVYEDLARVASLDGDNESQQQRLRDLQPRLAAQLRAAENLIAERYRADKVPRQATFMQNQKCMEAVQAGLAEMQAEESRLLEKRKVTTSEERSRTTTAAIASALAGMVLLALAGFVINREIGQAAVMRGQLEKLNLDLEQRVVQRTAELAETQQQHERILQSAMDAIVTVDEQQRITLFNSAAEKIFQYRSQEILGKPLECLLPERFRAVHSGHISRFASGGVTNRTMGALGSLWALRADGEEFQIEASISQTEGAGKKLFTVILRDVTERLRSEEAFRSQRRTLQLILDSMDEGLVAADEQGKFILWNRAAKVLVGQGPSDMPPEEWGKHYQVFFTDGVTPVPTDQNPLVRAMRGESAHMELIVRGPDNPEGAWLELTGQPLRNENGATCGGLVAFRDVTAQKHAEATLVENARLLDLAQVLVCDMQSKIVLWTTGAQKLYGFTREEALGRIAHQLLRTQFPEPLAQIEEKIVQTGRWEGELVHQDREGRTLVIKSIWLLHRNPQGKPVRILEKNFDITQNKASEREIRRLNDELEQRVQQRTAQLEAANKEMEMFTYSVSHDLRAPLRHISGFSKILMEDFQSQLPEEAQRHVQRIVDGTHRMGMLVDDLLNLARVGRRDLSLQVTGLNSLVEEVVQSLQPDYAHRQVEWQIGKLPFVECDPSLMTQVFQNLISNALKFTQTRAQAVIEIGERQENGAPVVFVRDNGVGFSMKYADKLFGVFQRLHRQEDFEGTGVGLATVQRIIQKHGGRIWAEAELDKGATFYFTLATSQTAGIKSKATVAGERQ
jgi:PAS domain S-box-containing protein